MLDQKNNLDHVLLLQKTMCHVVSAVGWVTIHLIMHDEYSSSMYTQGQYGAPWPGRHGTHVLCSMPAPRYMTQKKNAINPYEQVSFTPSPTHQLLSKVKAHSHCPTLKIFVLTFLLLFSYVLSTSKVLQNIYRKRQ